MEGEVRSNKCQVMKERFVCMILRMFSKAFDRMTSGGGGGVIIFRLLLGLKGDVI